MRLTVQNLGPIAEADVTFGDLTILVGPQATGKSIFLQTLFLVEEGLSINYDLDDYGYDWESSSEFLDLVYGEGMHVIWGEQTKVDINEKPFELSSVCHRGSWLRNPNYSSQTGLLFIPASRALAMHNGWPRPFNNYETSDPYSLKKFSESLREELNKSAGQGAVWTLKIFYKEVESLLRRSIYNEGEVMINRGNKRRKLTLSSNQLDYAFLTWSTGQREFTPLLILIMRLLPLKTEYQASTIIIEEPEMGLHPKAIQAFLLLTLLLIHLGYKVILSTHSPVVLELAWALVFLKRGQAEAADVAALFDVEPTAELAPLFDRALTAETRVYYFDRTEADGRVRAQDISSLDAGNEDAGVADWGGLTSFSSRAGEVVSRVMARAV